VELHMTEKPHETAPATGSSDPAKTDLAPEEEPVTTGTVFLTLIFLMMIFGFWMLMYWELLNR
jgi:hypothetical protein